ncbi:MAG: type IV pilus modification protein PilV [Neisseriaceae bacterium]|nr:type IV pilus modification protein PilV [Neisseriaceae bacterium]
MNTATTSFKQQQGSTLIEILVSMFILALGLMALIAMQTRTSIGIKEAENQTIIAQATENLAENMMTNPILGVNPTTLETTKEYTHYDNSVHICDGSEAAPTKPTGTLTNPTNTNTGRTQLANYHMALFHYAVCQINGVEEAKIDPPDNKVYNQTTQGQVLHVTWTMSGSSDKQFTYDYPLDNN